MTVCAMIMIAVHTVRKIYVARWRIVLDIARAVIVMVIHMPRRRTPVAIMPVMPAVMTILMVSVVVPAIMPIAAVIAAVRVRRQTHDQACSRNQ